MSPVDVLRMVALWAHNLPGHVVREVHAAIEHHDSHSREPYLIYVGPGWRGGLFCRRGAVNDGGEMVEFATTDQIDIVMFPADAKWRGP